MLLSFLYPGFPLLLGQKATALLYHMPRFVNMSRKVHFQAVGFTIALVPLRSTGGVGEKMT